eukprot:9154308-Pyramimonas_sp.AAC.1
MAIFLLAMVSGYFRPSHLLSLTRGNFITPAPGVCRWWSLLLPGQQAAARRGGSGRRRGDAGQRL